MPNRPARLARRIPPLAGAIVAAGLALASATGGGVALADDDVPVQASSAVVSQWYDVTAAAIAAAAHKEPATESRDWADSWLAAARALGDHHGRRYTAAAIATAVHDTLTALDPAQQPQLDAALDSTLAAVPPGPARARGIAAGRRSAGQVLAERGADGLDTASLDIPFTPPAPAPGVWQPTPPSFGPAVRAGLGRARPFLLAGGSQFRPGPPPALDSARYLADLAEVRSVGAVGGVRTAEQTDVALFWEDQSVHLYVPVLRAVLGQGGLSAAREVWLVAVFHAISIDAQIAVYDTKFTYLFWRPVTAIRTGSVSPDPAWTPFFATPRHPEYPSGHAGYAGAAQRVLEEMVGPRPRQPVSFQSATDPGSTRTYRAWSTLTHENVDARVWEGVHFRLSDEAGASLGGEVARYDLEHLDRLGL